MILEWPRVEARMSSFATRKSVLADGRTFWMDLPMKVLGDEQWISENFCGCELGDKRISKRLLKVAGNMLAGPEQFIPQQNQQWADVKAAYRFFGNKNVTFQEYHKVIKSGCKHLNRFHPAQLKRVNRHPVDRLRESCRNDPVAVLSGPAQAVRYVGNGNTGGLAPFR